MGRIFLGDIPVDVLSLSQFLSQIEAFIKSKKIHQIVTLNSIMYTYTNYDIQLKEAILSADLILPDSIGIVKFIYYLTGIKLERIAGVDLMYNLCKFAAEKGYKIFLLGTKPYILFRLVSKLRQLFPGITIAGYHHGYFSNEVEKTVLSTIRQCQPDILFVALPTPKQEKWIYGNLKNISTAVVIGVGGSFDVISGKLYRAPHFLQKLHLEWLFRFLQEPWRIVYIKHLLFFLFDVIKKLYHHKQYKQTLRRLF